MNRQTSASLPNSPGTYALIFSVAQVEKLSIGRIGLTEFDPGYFMYIGSALGPGGLSSRVNRHLRPNREKALHWHVDYLNPHADIHQIWWKTGEQRAECRWSKRLSSRGWPSVPAFGASDCACVSHLFYFQTCEELQEGWVQLRQQVGANLYRVRLIG